MTLASQLSAIQTNKLSIKTAISAKGIDMSGVPFSEYGAKIAMISSDGSPAPTTSGFTVQGYSLMGSKRKTTVVGTDSSPGYLCAHPSGKFLQFVTNQSWFETRGRGYLVAFNADSSVDVAFGTEGAVDLKPLFETTQPVFGSYAKHLESGKILIACGSSYDNGRGRVFLARLLVDGTIDTTFGVNGVVDLSDANQTQVFHQALVGDDGVIWVVLLETEDNQFKRLVRRFTVEGELLPTVFEGDSLKIPVGFLGDWLVPRTAGGYFLVTTFYVYDSASMEILAPTINYTGDMNANTLMMVYAYNADGTPDLIYNNNTKSGISKAQNPNFQLNTIVNDGSDNLLCLGGSNYKSGIMRLTSDLETDLTYGVNGSYNDTVLNAAPFTAGYVDSVTQEVLGLTSHAFQGKSGILISKITPEGGIDTVFPSGSTLVIVPQFNVGNAQMIVPVPTGFLVTGAANFGDGGQLHGMSHLVIGFNGDVVESGTETMGLSVGEEIYRQINGTVIKVTYSDGSGGTYSEILNQAT